LVTKCLLANNVRKAHLMHDIDHHLDEESLVHHNISNEYLITVSFSMRRIFTINLIVEMAIECWVIFPFHN
jgi:hypothetical protein